MSGRENSVIWRPRVWTLGRQRTDDLKEQGLTLPGPWDAAVYERCLGQRGGGDVD